MTETLGQIQNLFYQYDGLIMPYRYRGSQLKSGYENFGTFANL